MPKETKIFQKMKNMSVDKNEIIEPGFLSVQKPDECLKHIWRFLGEIFKKIRKIRGNLKINITKWKIS